MSRQEYVLRKFVTVSFIFTMYFSGGLIPGYLLVRDLGMWELWVYIIPGMIGVFNLIIIRWFIEGLPDGILEAARIDGASDFAMFMRIVLPSASVPVLGDSALFSAVSQWNSWFDRLLV